MLNMYNKVEYTNESNYFSRGIRKPGGKSPGKPLTTCDFPGRGPAPLPPQIRLWIKRP